MFPIRSGRLILLPLGSSDYLKKVIAALTVIVYRFKIKGKQTKHINSIHLLQHAIRDTCADYISVTTYEEADSAFRLEELQKNLLTQLNISLNEKEKTAVTLKFLKSELINNKLFSIQLGIQNGFEEVWLVKKIK
jgi:hypothetical protein